MRLRDILPHANFVASVVHMSDTDIFLCARKAIALQRKIQEHPPTLIDMAFAFDLTQDIPDWCDHILALMLLRDCLGREMERRDLTPPGPPMLARDWTSGGIYDCVCSLGIEMPPWLVERSDVRLASLGLAGYTAAEGE